MLNMPKIVIDKDQFIQPLSPNFSTSPLIYGGVVNYAVDFDPLREGLIGYATPGMAPSNIADAGNVLGNDLQTAVAQYSTAWNAYAYIVGSGAKIHRLDTAVNTLAQSGTFPHTITPAAHTAPVGSSAIIYRMNQNSVAGNYLLVAYNDATDGDILTYDLNTTFVEEWLTAGTYKPTGAAALVKGLEHPMVLGDDGRVHVLNSTAGNKLASLNGNDGTANGTWSAGTLTLPPGYVMTGAIRGGRYLVITAVDSYNASPFLAMPARKDAHVFLWDYAQADPFDAIPVNDNHVMCPVWYRGELYVFTQGRQAKAKLKKLVNRAFITVAEWGGNIPRYADGVDIWRNGITWIDGVNGNVYYYGTTHEGFPAGFHQITNTSTIASQTGFLKNLYSNALYASDFNVTEKEIHLISGNYISSAQWRSMYIEPSFEKGMIGEIESVEIFFPAPAAGLSLTPILGIDYDRTSVTLTAINNTNNASTNSITYNLDSSGNPFPFFTSLQLRLAWSAGTGSTDAPKISKVVINYKEVNNPN